mmetsp:Transcript_12248/g.37547  ORF Transcript_12248/g.37547 Transcript_12248/m.37547 type:complete len:108 (-) Transcript_12248:2879-3202(-)
MGTHIVALVIHMENGRIALCDLPLVENDVGDKTPALVVALCVGNEALLLEAQSIGCLVPMLVRESGDGQALAGFGLVLDRLERGEGSISDGAGACTGAECTSLGGEC